VLKAAAAAIVRVAKGANINQYLKENLFFMPKQLQKKLRNDIILR
jgi:hypothetical protein